MLDGEDTDQGYIKAGKRGQQPSRFWAGAKKGEFGERLFGYADSGNQKVVYRWMEANAAASKLLGSSVSIDTLELPLVSALELGITPHIQRKLDRQKIRCGDGVERGREG